MIHKTRRAFRELIRRAEQFKCSKITVTQPNEWRVIEDLSNVPLTVEFKEDNRFISRISEFNNWAEGRKQLRMEYFYRDMRRKTGLLMDGEKPVGGKWITIKKTANPHQTRFYILDQNVSQYGTYEVGYRFSV